MPTRNWRSGSRTISIRDDKLRQTVCRRPRSSRCELDTASLATTLLGTAAHIRVRQLPTSFYLIDSYALRIRDIYSLGYWDGESRQAPAEPSQKKPRPLPVPRPMQAGACVEGHRREAVSGTGRYRHRSFAARLGMHGSFGQSRITTMGQGWRFASTH